MAFNLKALIDAVGKFDQGAMRPQMDYRYGVDDQTPRDPFGGDDNSRKQLGNAAVQWWKRATTPAIGNDLPEQGGITGHYVNPDMPQPNPEMIGKSGQQPSFPVMPQPPANVGGVPDGTQMPADLPSSTAPTASVLGSRIPGYDDAQAKLVSAITAPIQKQKWWKDALYKTGELASNIYQGGWGDPRNQMQVEGYGRGLHDRDINRAYQQYAPLRQLEDQRVGDIAKATAIQNTVDDNRRADQQAKDLSEYRQGTLQERDENRKSRDANTKMRTVASMLSKIPNYDPSDPRFANITKALGDVGLPLAPKDAKKNVRLLQDAETGAWTLTLTDPYSGQQEVRPVTDKSGKQLVTTSTAKVAADAAAGRQESQQTYDAKKQQIAQQLSKELDDYKTANKEMLAEKDQARKLEMQKAIEDRQKHIKQLQSDLIDALGN